MLSKYSAAVGEVTRLFMSASQIEMHTLSVVSIFVSGSPLMDECIQGLWLSKRVNLSIKHGSKLDERHNGSFTLRVICVHVCWRLQGCIWCLRPLAPPCCFALRPLRFETTIIKGHGTKRQHIKCRRKYCCTKPIRILRRFPPSLC
jgi:hypothetical protein